MNNYCTNCGKKIDEGAIKCNECNTYVVDLKPKNSKKTFRNVMTVIVVAILIIIGYCVCSHYYYKDYLSKNLYNKYLKDEYKDAEFVKFDSCRECTGSCDGSCSSSRKRSGCYRYFYKSSPIGEEDILIISDNGDVSVDDYSSIIKKYEFELDSSDSINSYTYRKRSYLRFSVKKLNSRNIEKLYNMINELIDSYKKDMEDELEILIYIDEEYHDLRITNENTGNLSDFAWSFDNESQIINPSLYEVDMLCKSYLRYYSDKWYYYYD